MMHYKQSKILSSQVNTRYKGCEVEWGQPTLFTTSFMVGQEDKRTNNRTMLPAIKNNAAAGYQGPVKIELLKGAGLLDECEFGS